MTEPEARALLRHWPGLGGLEAWIAEQPWQEAAGGLDRDGLAAERVESGPGCPTRRVGGAGSLLCD